MRFSAVTVTHRAFNGFFRSRLLAHRVPGSRIKRSVIKTARAAVARRAATSRHVRHKSRSNHCISPLGDLAEFDDTENCNRNAPRHIIRLTETKYI